MRNDICTGRELAVKVAAKMRVGLRETQGDGSVVWWKTVAEWR